MTIQIRPYAPLRQGGQPPYLHPAYTSTVARAPKRALLPMPQTLSEVTGPTFDTAWFGPELADMTRLDNGEAQGERMILAGRVLDEDGRPVPKHAARDLAVQRRRALPPRPRPARCTARPAFPRRRPGRDQRAGRIPRR